MRKVLIRTVSGVIFLAVLLTALLWRAESFGLAFLFITVQMMNEYTRMALKGSFPVSRALTLLAGASTFCISWGIFALGISPAALLIIPISIPVILISVLFEGKKYDYIDSAFLLSSLFYIAVPFSLTNLIAFSFDPSVPGWTFDGLTILAIFCLVWASDIGAYIFGMSLGRVLSAKLCPSISPNKTWTGVIGGLVCSLLTGWLIAKNGMVNFGIANTLGLALLVDVFGVTGDLAESQMKRHYGVKDSGNIMPGHGGLLDRFDAAIAAIPIAVAYIYLFIK